MTDSGTKKEQKLVELGLDVNTADMKYDPRWDIPVLLGNDIDNVLDEEDIPAWSLTALFDKMPNIGNDLNFFKAGPLYAVHYQGVHCTNAYYNPVDAAFEAVVWLLEHNYIKND